MIDKNELKELLLNMIAIDSPYYSEDDIMEYCLNWLTNQGIKAYIHNYKEEIITGFAGKNIVASLKGESAGKKIILNGHLDTVPLCEGWTKDYKGVEEGDRIYGLGALDMKSGCAALMMALKAFKEENEAFSGEIILTLVSDEEGPYGLGTDALIRDGILEKSDVCIVTEPSAGFDRKASYPHICLGARGCFVYEVVFRGRTAHASQPETGLNAAVAAAAFITESENVRLKEKAPLGKGSFCILRCESDGGACSVPEKAVVTVHRHITMGETEEYVIAEAEKIIEKAGIRCEYEIRLREYPHEGCRNYEPYYVDENNRYARLLMEAAGDDVSTGYFSSIGDFNYLGTRLDTPVFVFGPDGGNMHGADEYVITETVYSTCETIFSFLKKCLKK